MPELTVRTIVLDGVHGHLVHIEAWPQHGLPLVVLGGLPAHTAGEVRDRVRAAVAAAGHPWPGQRIVVSLLPAAIPKPGTSYDLAVACAVLAAAGHLPAAALGGTVLIGQLDPDGSVQPVRGVLPMVAAAARAGADTVVVPLANAAEAALVGGVTVHATDTLRRLIAWAHGRQQLLHPPPPAPATGGHSRPGPDLADLVVPPLARRALEVAAAGGHNLAIVGAPGTGKTLLARALPPLLPDLDDHAAWEVTTVHSVAGALPAGSPLLRRPPFQAPHHRITVPALVGGGNSPMRPGAISLAHRGVLFLDQAPEVSQQALDSLRQPLEDQQVHLRRGQQKVTFPAQVQLLAAANPCPCGTPAGSTCDCTPLMRRRYLGRLAGTLADRIGIHLPLAPPDPATPEHTGQVEPSVVVAERVATARVTAAARWAGHGPSTTNNHVPATVLRHVRWRPPLRVLAPAHQLVATGSLSARGLDRVTRLAWTIADLAGRTTPDHDDVHEALHLTAQVIP